MADLFALLSAGLGIVSSLLLAALLYVRNQRDREKRRADDAEHRADSTDRAREAERRIDERRAEARKESQGVQREHDDHKSAGTRPDRFGDSRLNRRIDD